MKNIVLVLLGLILIAGVVYFVMDKDTALAPETENVTENTNDENGETNDRAVKGTVVTVNTDQVPVDGPALVTIRVEDGTQAVIAVPSMGINFCAAQANLADVYSIKSGDRVEARGQVGVDSMIIPCQSAAHYLRVVSQ